MRGKLDTFVVLFMFFNDVLSLEEGNRLSYNLSSAICKHFEMHRESGITYDVVPQKVPLAHIDRSFKRTECSSRRWNCDDLFTVDKETSGKSFRDSIIGPQSQFNFRTTKTLAADKTLYVHVTYPELSWPLALYACASNGMVLADIRDSSHKFALQGLLLKSFSDNERADVWIGGSRFTDDSYHQRFDWFLGGKTIDNFIWPPVPGGNSGPPYPPKEYCMTLSNVEGKGTFYGYEHNCKDQLTFLCRTLV